MKRRQESRLRVLYKYTGRGWSFLLDDRDVDLSVVETLGHGFDQANDDRFESFSFRIIMKDDVPVLLVSTSDFDSKTFTICTKKC